MQSILNHINNYSKKSWIQFLLFSGVIWLIFVHLHINRHLEDMIIGPHYWRKSDTYAQIMNYYYNGLNFFDHGIYFNQMNSKGKAVAEFPLIYWLIALQLKLFGNYILVIKINYIIILFTGLFSVFKIANHFLKNFGFSLLVATVLFLSPVFTSYSLAFLPDPLALNLSFIGLWLLLKFNKNKKVKTMVLSMVFLSISAMIKPFFLIPYLAFLGTVIVNQLILKKEFVKFKWSYLIPLVLVFVWFYYTNWYNSSVKSDYFLSETRPIWNYSSEEITLIWNRINERWLIEYIHPNLLWIFFILIVVNLIWWPKKKIIYNLYHLFSVLGSLSFIILLFNMFRDHDYYIYPLLFILPLTIGLFIYKLIGVVQSKVIKNLFSIVLLLVVYLGLNHTWLIVEHRRKAPLISSTHLFEGYNNLEYFLNKNNVKKTDYVIAYSDKSPSFALTLLNRKGWSGFQTKLKNKSVTKLIDMGASYLIINKNAPVLRDSVVIIGYTDYFIDDTNNVYLYDLKPYKD